MIRQRLGLDRSKNYTTNEQSQTYDNSCGSLGLSTERDLIGNLLTPDEPSIEDDLLRKLPTDALKSNQLSIPLQPKTSLFSPSQASKDKTLSTAHKEQTAS